VRGAYEADVALAVSVYSYTDHLIFLVAFWVLGSAVHVTAAGTESPCPCTKYSIVFSLQNFAVESFVFPWTSIVAN